VCVCVCVRARVCVCVCVCVVFESFFVLAISECLFYVPVNVRFHVRVLRPSIPIRCIQIMYLFRPLNRH
jgi:hypothetical protein